ncbi:MAG: flavin reductase family protein [Actinomycetota bacterium]|nr:flavin reductase family protein [Actinomycetota bacterium]
MSPSEDESPTPSAGGLANGGPSVIEVAELRNVLGHFATGVVVVTGAGRSGPAGLTCQSFFSLSLDPPMVAVAPARTSQSWPFIHRSEAFCVNVLAAAQESLGRAFATSGGDKFAGVGWSPAATGSPRLHDVLAWIDCRLVDAHEGGDHHLIVGRIVEMGSAPGEPLVFYRGGFGSFRS